MVDGFRFYLIAMVGCCAGGLLGKRAEPFLGVHGDLLSYLLVWALTVLLLSAIAPWEKPK